MHFFESIPNKGLQIARNKDVEYRLRYAPGRHNVGLLELFGLISVRNGRPVQNKAWSIEHVNHILFRDALLTLLLEGFFADMEKYL